MPRPLLIILFLILIIPHSYAQTTQNNDDNVTLDEKIGQLLLVGFRGTQLADTNHVVRDIKKYHLGSVVLFDYDVSLDSPERNIESPEQVKTLVNDLKQTADHPLIVSIDQEGGKVARLKAERGFPETVSAEYLGSIDHPDSTKYYARKIAATLADLGINMNFAPVVDLNTNPENPIIGGIERSFSAEPEKVTKHASIFIKTFKEHDILPVLKHFPGHGSSEDDSHLGVVDVSETWSDDELKPYQELIDKEMTDAIMTAHIFNDNLDSKLPATLSKPTITDLLRNDLGFDGVVISDDMMMGAIRNEYGLETAIYNALHAGVDILTFGNNLVFDPEIVPKAHRIIKKLVEDGKISEQRIDQSYHRVMKLKEQIDGE
ncbi:MAG: glycoside hydrolase family 3 protein [Bacteroidota bacterium]